MKRWIPCVLIGWLAAQAFVAMAADKSKLEWFTDLPKAMAKAKEENKVVLLDFTGSDWCPPCIMMKKNVLSKPAFAEYAQKNLVLVEVDFPQRKKLSAAQQKANEALAAKYNPEGMIPTYVLLDKEGKVLGSTGFTPGGPKEFIAELEKLKKT